MLYGKKKGTAKFTELVEIKDTPDTGSDPEQIDVTTLKRKTKAYVEGRTDNIHDFLVKYPDGTGTTIKGSAKTRINGISLNSAIEATLIITPVDIDFKTSTEVTALLAD